MPIRAYIAEGVYSVDYQTSRAGTIATGFNLTITDSISVEHDGEIEVGIEGDTDEKFLLGSKFGIVLSDGVSRSRTHTGRTTVVVDPIMDLFKKAIIVNKSDVSEYLGKAIGVDKENTKNDFVVILGPGDVARANSFLKNGKIIEFIDIMFGMSGGRTKDTVIVADKAIESPIIRNLSKLIPSVQVADNGSFFTHDASFSQDGIYTVEAIFQQTLSSLGLELYWVKDNIYSLEPPRLTNPNAKIEPNVITKADIISIV